MAKKTAKKEKAEKKDRPVNTERTLMKEITFSLSDKEKAELGKKAGEVDREILILNEEFKDVKDDYKRRIGAKALELKSLLKASREGKQERMVEVLEVKDFDAVKVKYMLKGKVVLERDMEWAERQTEMKVDTNGKSKKTAKDDVRAKMATSVDSGASGLNGTSDDVKDVIKEETNKKTKKSAVDASVN